MGKVDTHGLKMIGLRSACSETKYLPGDYSGHYVQISYDISSGEILTNYHVSLGENSWTQYNDQSVSTVCNVSRPKTMQEIADLVSSAVQDSKRGFGVIH